MSDERDAYLALTQVPGLGPARLQTLLAACHTPLGAHSAPFALLCTVPGVSRALATEIKRTPLAAGRRLARGRVLRAAVHSLVATGGLVGRVPHAAGASSSRSDARGVCDPTAFLLSDQ